MRISAKVRYAFRFSILLALNYDKKLVQVKEVARIEGISPKYLEQIAMSLKLANIVTVTRGSKGGYSLSRPASEISLLEIIQAVEGDIVLTECVEAADSCERHEDCKMNKFWIDFNTHINGYLKSKTLEGML